MTAQWIVILVLASLILHHQSNTTSRLDHTDFVEGHFCGEIADSVDILKTTDPG